MINEILSQGFVFRLVHHLRRLFYFLTNSSGTYSKIERHFREVMGSWSEVEAFKV